MSTEVRHGARRLLGVVFCGLLWMLGAVSSGQAECRQGVREVSESFAPLLVDDGSRASLRAAIGRSRAALRSLSPAADRGWQAGVFSRAARSATLVKAEQVLDENPGMDALVEALDRNFAVYEACDEKAEQGRDGNPLSALVTGYFEPELAGSLVPHAAYGFPLYALPRDLEEGRIGDNGRRRVWQRRGFLFSYPSRDEIEETGLLHGSELVWLADPVERFILHIQGSGRIRLPDGGVRRVRYAGNNGHSYTSIGRVLVAEGRLSREDADLPGIQKYLREHPEEQKRILYQNERYIFFDWNNGDLAAGPPGSLGVPLTPGRSVALDPAVYPPGVIGFLDTTRPRFDARGELFSWVSLRRLVVAQDTGAAIKGPGRVDFFYGGGPYARQAAGVMRQPGRFFLLLHRDSVSGSRSFPMFGVAPSSPPVI